MDWLEDQRTCHPVSAHLAERLFHFANQRHFVGHIPPCLGTPTKGNILRDPPILRILMTAQQISHSADFRHYDEAALTKISNVVTAILSSLLPTVVILVLYFVNRMLTRIGLIITFTSVFSLALALFTEAKKVEVFTATAA